MKEFERLDTLARKYRIIAMSLILLPIWAFLLWFIFLCQKPSAFAPLLIFIAAAAMLVAFVFTLLSAIVTSNSIRFKMDEKGFTFIKSFIYRKQVFVPKDRILPEFKQKRAFLSKKLYRLEILNDSDGVVIRYLTGSQVALIKSAGGQRA